MAPKAKNPTTFRLKDIPGDLTIEMAREYYQNDVQFKDILADLDRSKREQYRITRPGHVSSIVASGRKQDLFRVTVQETPPWRALPDDDWRVQQLERNLGVRAVLVEWAGYHVACMENLSRAEDNLHYYLAHALARRLAELVRPGDMIANTGGRAPYFTATHMLENGMSRRYDDVLVCPVTGRIQTVTWDDSYAAAKSLVDADATAFILAKALGGRLNPNLVGLDGVSDNQTDVATGRQQIRAQLGLDGTATRSILALCGIGRIAQRHRYALALEGKLGDADAAKTLRKPLGDLAKCCGTVKGCRDDCIPSGIRDQLGAVLPLGDIANRVFWCGEGEYQLCSPTAKGALTEINDQVIGISLTDLGRIPLVIACAGGYSKLSAVTMAMQLARVSPKSPPEDSPHPKRLITMLATDAWTAERLIEDHTLRDTERMIPVGDLPGESAPQRHNGDEEGGGS